MKVTPDGKYGTRGNPTEQVEVSHNLGDDIYPFTVARGQKRWTVTEDGKQIDGEIGIGDLVPLEETATDQSAEIARLKAQVKALRKCVSNLIDYVEASK